MTPLRSFAEWLGERGLAEAGLESRGEVLVVQLAIERYCDLLADADLRHQLTAVAKTFGFDRVALELS